MRGERNSLRRNEEAMLVGIEMIGLPRQARSALRAGRPLCA
jgi:hypothetical protein